MPTCSQAKIITNLESSDLNRRLFSLVADEGNRHINEAIKGESPNEAKSAVSRSQPQIKHATKRHDCVGKNRTAKEPQKGHTPAQVVRMQRKITIDEIPHQPLVSTTREANFQLLKLHKVPIVFGEVTLPNRRHTNGNARLVRAQSFMNNQMRINTLRSELNLNLSQRQQQCYYGLTRQIWGSEADDEFEQSSSTPTTASPTSNSTGSRTSCSEVDKRSVSSGENNNHNQIGTILTRKSFDYNQCLPIRSKRNSIEETTGLIKLPTEAGYLARRNSLVGLNNINQNNATAISRFISNNFPKLGSDVEANVLYSTQAGLLLGPGLNEENDSPSSSSSTSRKISLDQAKRLLALASIRPSKTFHKSMTDEEIEVLKKYYELMKPKGSINSSAANAALEAAERAKYQNSPPVVYNTAKLNSNTLITLRNLLEQYKKDLDSGEYSLEFDQSSEDSIGRFVLKSTGRSSNPTTIRFPDDLNDALVAFAVNTGDRENRTLGEANLYRIINWNDAGVTSPILNPGTCQVKQKKSKTSDHLPLISPPNGQSDSPSSSSSTISFEDIRNLSSLISTILEPKIVKKLTYTGVDVGVLPGSANFDMPSFEELGINLDGLLSKYSNNNPINPSAGLIDNDLNKNNIQETEFQSAKLKNSAYKKLREKVSKSKVMYFACLPERRPLSVIFELPSEADLGHQAILDEVNGYLKEVGGRVESVEFVPRSVLLNSVYIDNMWILTLNNSSTRFYTINNGIQIRGRKYGVRSYDEFIFAEYEKFVKTEKYKQLIRNHERAVQNQARKTAKNRM